jgi:hypothetical protein
LLCLLNKKDTKRAPRAFVNLVVLKNKKNVSLSAGWSYVDLRAMAECERLRVSYGAVMAGMGRRSVEPHRRHSQDRQAAARAATIFHQPDGAIWLVFLAWHFPFVTLNSLQNQCAARQKAAISHLCACVRFLFLLSSLWRN